MPCVDTYNMSSPVAKAARLVTHELHGVVVSAGLMQKTVKVRVGGQKWNKIVNKVSCELHEYTHMRAYRHTCVYMGVHLADNGPSISPTPKTTSFTTPTPHYGPAT